ncbi:MAG: hypothetical protein JNL12_00790 [Planctomycetes bacterium]|nr:hypothetical protein [Planctomycetota bacterium]
MRLRAFVAGGLLAVLGVAVLVALAIARAECFYSLDDSVLGQTLASFEARWGRPDRVSEGEIDDLPPWHKSVLLRGLERIGGDPGVGLYACWNGVLSDTQVGFLFVGGRWVAAGGWVMGRWLIL